MSKLVCMTGSAGDKAAAELFEQNAALFSERFPESFLEKVRELKKHLPPRLFKPHVTPIGKGGLWAALWDLGEAAGTGLTVDAAAIPVHQEVIEICELLGLDPYALPSSGVVFLRDPQEVLAERDKKEDPAGTEDSTEKDNVHALDYAVIGHTTDTAARIVRIGERIRYLNRSSQ